MTVTLADRPTWPDGDPGKVLLNCIINTNVDETFEELFGSYPETQAKLHKQRHDTNCAESPWVPQRSQLPAQQFAWPAPPAGADPGTPAQGKYRKVRFDAAASIASKAFSSEEIQHVLQYSPGSHYQLATEVYTTAMYGDTFTVISRYTLAGKGPGKTHLHVLYAIAFKPSLSRLMKPMVAKGVDGGIRGSFSVLKRLLQDQYGLSDLPETAPPPSVPGAPAAAAEAAGAPPAAAAQLPQVLAPAAQVPGLLALADYVVYQDLVASLVQVSDPQLIAKALAVCLTLVLINMLIMFLRPISQACAAAAASGSGVLSWLCWPVSLGLDIPDSLGEVLGALLLVAVANKLLLLGVEVAAGALKGSPSPSVAASRAPSMLGAALSAVAAAASSGQQPAAVTAPTNGNLAPASAAASTQATAAAATGNQSQQGRQGLSPRQQKSSPVAIPSKAANGSGGGGGGGSGGGVEAALSNFSNAVTGWGRNLLGAGVVDSFSSNEGLKALVTGPWSKSAENLKANDAGQGPGSTPEGAARLSNAGSGPGRAPSHRHTNSFTTVMDPSGLNIIEDYDQQLLRNPSQENLGQLPRLVEEQSAATSPATSEVGPTGPFAAAAAAGAKGAGSIEAKGGKAAAAEALRAAERSASGRSAGSSPARSGSPSKQPTGRSSSPSKMKRAGSSKKALSQADAEARQPLLSALSGEGSVGQPSSQAGSTTQQQGPGQGASRPSTPVPCDDESVPPLLDSASPIVPRGAQSQAQNARSSKSVTFSHSPNTPDSTTGPLAGSHSAAAMLTGASKSAGGVVGSAALSTRSSPLARRSASPMLYGASPPPDGGFAADSPNIGRLGMSGMSASYEALSASSGSSGVGTVPAVAPGQEDADEVLVEVFEHERVQPFRGWGHTWPGHFLPSDKVGHWGDRSGAPGGAVSMLFDRVAPKLPTGWTWLDPEWTVDMTGAEWEGCDTDGWSYGMDFSWITWPPGPQMGKPGMKSFVRRRRWVRMRARLAPGAEAPEEQSQQGSPVLASQLDSSLQQQASSAPNSARDSDGGFMAGLSTGLGLVSNESASAAAAAAGAMVSRFMKAVQDLPLAPRGSSGGSELGLGTSPPTVPTAADAAAALQQQPASAAAAAGKDTAAGAAVQEEQGKGTSREVGPDAGSKQQQQPPVISSKSSNAGSSRRGGDSGNVSDSDSSSVNSDLPPPRPRLSEELAELRQDQAAGLTQPDAAEAAVVTSATAAATAAEEVEEKESVSTADKPVFKAGSSSTAAAAAAAAQAEPAAPATVGSCSSTLKEPSADADVGKADTAHAAAGAATEGKAAATTAPTAPVEPPQEGLPAVQASDIPTSKVKQQSAPTAAAGPDKPVEAAPQTPTAVVGPAADAPPASAAKEGGSLVADSGEPTCSKAAVPGAGGEEAPAAAAAAVAGAGESRSAGTDSKRHQQQQQQGKAEAAAGAGGDPGAAGAAVGGIHEVGGGITAAGLAGAARLIPSSSTGGGSAVGSGDWVWSAAEAAAADAKDTPTSTPRAAAQQQTPLETVGGSGELPSSPLSVDTPTSPMQLRGSGVVNRTSSGGAGRGIVRTGSGARGGRGKQSKLGAVPLRRSGEGSTGGAAASSNVAGTAAGSATGAGLVSAAPPATVSGGSIGAAAGSSSGSRALPPAPPAAEPASASAAAGASTSQQAAKAAVPAHVSGEDMGSGLGWPSSPDKQQVPSVQEDRGEGGQPTGADGQQKAAGQKSWDEW